MKSMRIAGLVLAGALVAVGASGARAQEEGVFMKDILGSIGIIEKDKPRIDYRERAPLVVPPRLELREPVSPGSVEARNPQWPHDPDVSEAARRKAEARVPVTEMERRRMHGKSTRLSVDEIRADRRPGAGVPTDPVVRSGDNSREDTWVSPDKLRAQGRPAESLVAGAEPERRSLSEPPAGLRKPAPGAELRQDFEPVVRTDEADPGAYFRQQNKR